MTEAVDLITTRVGSASDAGLRRAINEDSMLAASPLFLVADGMGGHHAGEIASGTVIEVFAAHVGRESLSIDDVQTALAQARSAVAQLPAGMSAGAGTTLTGVVVADVGDEGYWLVFNIGDSRTYLLSDGVFEQISVDHSVVQELVDSGQLDAAAAAVDARRNVITRAIGGGGDSDADFWLIPADAGDRVLACSDGLSGELSHTEIEAILRSETAPQDAAERLVREAVRRGGRDNITAVVVDALSVRSRAGGADIHSTLPSAARSAEADPFDADTRPRVAAGGDRR